MSLPKKGSRKIIVNGSEFLWFVRAKPTYSQDCLGSNMTAAVELLDSNGSILHITFTFSRPDSAINFVVGSVTPKLIELCIKNAIDLGWKPDASEGVFEYLHQPV
ncbi:MAG: hypothetical protein AAGC78_18355 [Cellvibrio sp.]|uniref:hypothetical protein n=1 Tax=Cellvibrio sp. TaxID=1965322 RepID=UPI0031AD0433